MDAISYKMFRANPAAAMDRASQDHSPIIITRNHKPSVVIMSLEDYNSIAETAYLLRSPANAKRLLESITELGSENGRNPY